jgi:hypothetical protein
VTEVACRIARTGIGTLSVIDHRGRLVGLIDLLRITPGGATPAATAA